MSVLGSFVFRDMVIEVEELVSADFHFSVLWLHRVDDGLRDTIVVHRDGRFFPAPGADLGELGLAELGICLDRFLSRRSIGITGGPALGAGGDKQEGAD